jgi:uncharacterized protein YegL
VIYEPETKKFRGDAKSELIRLDWISSDDDSGLQIKKSPAGGKMKRAELIYRVLFLMIIMAIGGCSNSEKADLNFYLFGDYTNTTGENPQFVIDEELTDEEIYFDGVIEYEVAPPDVRLRMNNMSIYSENENYYIDNVEVEEKVDDDWVWFPEFEVEFGNLTQLGVVLVLDVSQSLGNDFDDVLTYAVEFVEIVVENAPEAQIGVVSFSDTIQILAPGTDITAIESFISGQMTGIYTRMYDAIAEGMNLLAVLEVDGRALVTFTDGRDNYSTITPAELVEEMNELGVRSYTMGLEGKGGVNATVLSQLAVNGQYRLTASKSDLRKVFQYFARSVSNVYQIDYRRSSQVIQTPRQLRYKFIDEK